MLLLTSRPSAPIAEWRYALLKLRNQYFLEFPITCFSEPAYWWVIIDKNKIIAFAACKIHANRQAEMCACGVIPKYRGRGLQGVLLRAREEFAITQGCRAANSYTSRYNFASINNLIGCGYRMYHPHNADHNFLYFRKKLEVMSDVANQPNFRRLDSGGYPIPFERDNTPS